MGAPGWTSFCKNGHIVQTCGHHEIIHDALRECELCGEPVIGTCIEWGDPDYGPPDVPYLHLRTEKLKIARTFNGYTKIYDVPVKVYDVTKLLQKRKLYEEV